MEKFLENIEKKQKYVGYQQISPFSTIFYPIKNKFHHLVYI